MTSKPPYPKLPAWAAFLHVIYDHRYLAVAGYAWNRFGPAGSPATQAEMNERIPGAGVLIQDSLLMHARPLINFYTMTSTDPTDIVLSDFGLPPLKPQTADQLDLFKDPISVHLMHLTAWRDYDYRDKHQTMSKGTKRGRPDWDQENSRIPAAIFDALDEVAGSTVSWSTPFKELHAASVAVLADPGFGWPEHLTEKADVDKYLRTLGLVGRP